MKELCRSHSLSYLQGLQVAMEAHGIKTTLFDEHSLGYMGFAGQIRLMVERDADFEPAMQIVRDLQAAAPVRQTPSSGKVQRWGCVGMVAGFVLLTVGVAVQSETTGLAYGLVVGAAVVFAMSLALIILGPRRDRPNAK